MLDTDRLIVISNGSRIIIIISIDGKTLRSIVNLVSMTYILLNLIYYNRLFTANNLYFMDSDPNSLS
jgi:ABC-type xylose transport system substrate-binding protein